MGEPVDGRQLAAEAIGTAFLLATVAGSGIMGLKLAGGGIGLALLADTIATGAILVVLITLLGPISGAHFNPAVTAVMWARGDLGCGAALGYVAAQIAGGIAGALAAHLMFELPVWQLSTTVRAGPAQWFSEWVATFGLVFTILVGLKSAPSAVGWLVGLYITAAYWFTVSTSFANPAVTIARALSDTFAGIRPVDAPAFVLAQLAGAFLAYVVCHWLTEDARAY